MVFDRALALLPSSSSRKFPSDDEVNEKSSASFGFAALTMVIDPRLTFVNVQVTVSFAETAIASTEEPSLQIADWRSHPAGTVSATE